MCDRQDDRRQGNHEGGPLQEYVDNRPGTDSRRSVEGVFPDSADSCTETETGIAAAEKLTPRP